MGRLIESLESRQLMSVATPASDFGAGGKVSTTIGSVHGVDRDIAVLPDGRFLVAGVASVFNPNSAAFLARYKSNGKIDATFGNGGKILKRFGQSSVFNDITIEPDASILIVGSSATGTHLFHYSASGRLDGKFGKNSNVSLGNLSGVSVASTAGTIVVAGSYTSDPPGLNAYPAWGPTLYLRLIELNSGGALVSSFGENGTLDTGQTVEPTSVAVDSLGGITVCGSTGHGGLPGVTEVLRYTTAGQLDNTFAQGGVLQTDGFGITPDQSGGFIVSERQPILDSSGQATGRSTLILTRFTADGVADDGFGTGGLAVLAEPADGILNSSSIVVTADGILVATENYDLSPGTSSQPFDVFYELDISGRPGATPVSRAANGDVLSGLAVDGNLILTLGEVYKNGRLSAIGVEAYRE